MRIAVVTEGTVSDRIGEGHELRIYELFRRIAEDNEVHVIQPAPKRRVWNKDGIIIHDLPPARGALGKRLFERHFYLSRYLHVLNATFAVRRVNPEVVDIYGFTLPTLHPDIAVVGSFAYYEKGPDIGPLRSSLATWLRTRLTRTKVRVSDYLVMMSRNTEHQLERSGILDGKQCLYVPNGVDHKLFFRRDMQESRSALKLPEDLHIVLLCGQLAEIKRPLLFLEAFSLLPDSYHGVIVGRGPLKDKVADFVRTHNLESRISVAGFVDRELLPLYYSAADVTAYMGELEIQPLVPQESMACGTPPVVSNAPGNNELVQHGLTGALFKPGDLSDFTSNVRMICEDRTMRDALSGADIAFMSERSWDATAELTLKAYGAALETSKVRR